MFYEKSLFEIDPEEAKLPCQWCGEEVPEDELYHGVCLSGNTREKMQPKK